MMGNVFLNFLNTSIIACLPITAVIIARLAFKRVPKAFTCLLWALVAIRLALPFSLSAPFSLLPEAEPIKAELSVPYETVGGQTATVKPITSVAPVSPKPNVTEPIGNVRPTVEQRPVVEGAVAPSSAASAPIIDKAEEPALSAVTDEKTEKGADLPINVIGYASIAWIAGIACMALYVVVGYIRLRLKTRVCEKKGKDVFLCDNISEPFILGIFRPRIMLPSDVSPEDEKYIMLHERAHIGRGDHIWMALAFTLLALHWYNPLVWVAFFLFGRDTELACDERVVRDNGEEIKKPYANALITYSTAPRKVFSPSLTFGGKGIATRIKNLLHYKKPAVWVCVAFALTCVVIALCFMTVPVDGEEGEPVDATAETDGTTDAAYGTELTENTEMAENIEPTESTESTDNTEPTEEPTEAPTEKPTEAPTEEPTEAPTEKPTEAPTEEPTEAPTEEPTEAPTEEPTEAPTEEPTEAPTEKPTESKPTEPTYPLEPKYTFSLVGRDAMMEGAAVDYVNSLHDDDIEYIEAEKNVSFKWGSTAISGDDTGEWFRFSVFVIKDIDEYRAFATVMGYLDPEKYDEAYFKVNAVMLLVVQRVGYTTEQHVTMMKKKQGEICIGLDVTVESDVGGFPLVRKSATVLELSKSTLDGVDTISIYAQRLAPAEPKLLINGEVKPEITNIVLDYSSYKYKCALLPFEEVINELGGTVTWLNENVLSYNLGEEIVLDIRTCYFGPLERWDGDTPVFKYRVGALDAAYSEVCKKIDGVLMIDTFTFGMMLSMQYDSAFAWINWDTLEVNIQYSSN